MGELSVVVQLGFPVVDRAKGGIDRINKLWTKITVVMPNLILLRIYKLLYLHTYMI